MTLKFVPWGDNPVLDWDEWNLNEIAKHQVHDFEVAQCFENPHTVSPHKKARSQPERYSDRYMVRGITDGGRRLIIIVQHKGGEWIRPVTAFDEG